MPEHTKGLIAINIALFFAEPLSARVLISGILILSASFLLFSRTFSAIKK